jgi:hypothetical protein
LDETDAQRQPYWPELEELAKPAREHRRLAPETRGQIIIRLCRRAPLSVKDLSVLLDRSEAYIGDAIRPLVTAGELTFLYPDQPRHPRQKYLAASEVNVDLSPDEEFPLEIPQAYLAPATRPERRPEEPPYRSTPFAPPMPPPPMRANEPDEPPSVPNQVVNLAYAALAGGILGFMAPPLWWLIAIAASVALSLWHKLADSGQYRRFGTLEAFPSDGAFLLLKSLVTFVEIALVFLAIRAITGR